MTQAEYGLAFTFFVIAGIVTLYQRFGPIRRERLKVHRYKLFAVRDQLVLLVAEGKISEDDEVFLFLYGTVNNLIPHTKPLTLWGLVEGLNATELGKMRDDDSLRRHIMKSVDHSVPAVRKVARVFFSVVGGRYGARRRLRPQNRLHAGSEPQTTRPSQPKQTSD